MPEFAFTERDLWVALVSIVLVWLVFLAARWIRTRDTYDDQGDSGSSTRDVKEALLLRRELADLARRVAALEGRIEATPQRDTDDTTEDPYYGPALRMIRDGLPEEEVVSRLGLSKAEVDLLVSMHRQG